MSFMLYVPLDNIIESVIAVGGVLGELCSLGYRVVTIPVWDKFGHKSGRLFHFKHIKLGKSRYTRRFIPAKGEGAPAIREMKVEPKGRKGTEKCSPTFLCCSEQSGLVPRFHVIKTHILCPGWQ